MKANPQVGERAYSEGFAPPPIFWADFGKVVKVGQKKCVPIGCFEDVVVIEEFDAFEPPGIFQLKFHAPGVGNIGVDFKGNDPEKEVLELVKLVHLSPEDMAKVRKRVKEHERRAYTYGVHDVQQQTAAVVEADVIEPLDRGGVDNGSAVSGGGLT